MPTDSSEVLTGNRNRRVDRLGPSFAMQSQLVYGSLDGRENAMAREECTVESDRLDTSPRKHG